MAGDFEVEEGREVVRRLIVGGRPRARQKRKIRIPIGLEKVLCRAAGDEAFRSSFLRDRRQAVAAAGYELAPSEAGVLDSVPEATLALMIERIDVKRHARGRFMQGIMAATFAAATVSAAGACESDPAGTGADVGTTPDGASQPDDSGAVGGQDLLIVGQDVSAPPDILPAPDLPTDGIRPDIHDSPDVTFDLGITPDLIDEPDEWTSRGVEPDLVDVGEPMPAGILHDID